MLMNICEYLHVFLASSNNGEKMEKVKVMVSVSQHMHSKCGGKKTKKSWKKKRQYKQKKKKTYNMNFTWKIRFAKKSSHGIINLCRDLNQKNGTW